MVVVATVVPGAPGIVVALVTVVVELAGAGSAGRVVVMGLTMITGPSVGGSAPDSTIEVVVVLDVVEVLAVVVVVLSATVAAADDATGSDAGAVTSGAVGSTDGRSATAAATGDDATSTRSSTVPTANATAVIAIDTATAAEVMTGVPAWATCRGNNRSWAAHYSGPITRHRAPSEMPSIARTTVGSNCEPAHRLSSACGCVLPRAPLLVRPRRGHHVEGIGDGDDPGRAGDRRAA